MSLRSVIAMPKEERDALRAADEAVHDRVEALIASGVGRAKSFTRTGAAMGCRREDIIAAYWRHARKLGW